MNCRMSKCSDFEGFIKHKFNMIKKIIKLLKLYLFKISGGVMHLSINQIEYPAVYKGKNIDIFDFSLNEDDMYAVSALNRNLSFGCLSVRNQQ